MTGTNSLYELSLVEDLKSGETRFECLGQVESLQIFQMVNDYCPESITLYGITLLNQTSTVIEIFSGKITKTIVNSNNYNEVLLMLAVYCQTFNTSLEWDFSSYTDSGLYNWITRLQNSPYIERLALEVSYSGIKFGVNDYSFNLMKPHWSNPVNRVLLSADQARVP